MRLAALVMGSLFSAISLTGCGSELASTPYVPRFENHVKTAVQSSAPMFDFAGAEPSFDWDFVFVFDCYADQTTVEKSIGFSWPDFKKTTIKTSDGVCLVLFVKSHRVVGWYEQPRSIAELGKIARSIGYDRADAKFRVIYGGWAPTLVPATGPIPLIIH